MIGKGDKAEEKKVKNCVVCEERRDAYGVEIHSTAERHYTEKG